jgi:two-component system chemotaxis sensor kinase CheA
MSENPADIFRQEAADLLETLEQTLLDLEASPADRDLVDAAFRAMHTIKGSGAMFGFDEVAAFVHDFETAFDRVRKGQGPVPSGLVQVALSALDYIRMLVERPQDTDAVIGEALLADLQAQIGAVLPDSGAGDAGPAATATDSLQTWRIRMRFEPGILVNGTNPLALLDELRGLGECEVRPVLDALPGLESMDPTACWVAWDVVLVTTAARDAIEDVFMFVHDEMELVVEPTEVEDPAPVSGEGGERAVTEAHVDIPDDTPVAPSPRAAQKPREAAATAGDRAAATIRVDADRLDALMDRVGELVIAQARLSQIAASRGDLALAGVAEEIERLAAGLRDTTMEIRMVPIGTLFGRFRRLVFDLSRDLGKPLELVTSGEETELDKTMIERLADPLVHLIRNAVDHGLETPDVRRAAGKPENGTLRLTARHVGAEVLVTIADDGRGLDPERIRAKAEEQGLISPETKLTDAELFQYLFHPGFSTAREVSALSGRGVGMDVVKKVIESMRGGIELSTQKGQGTQVTLRLPLTLAIIEGLLVRVENARYIIPLACVEECVELPALEDGRGYGRNFLSIRGDLVPYLKLRTRFGAAGEPDPHEKVVVVASSDTRVGLVVDQIIGQHQTVIKSLSPLHAKVPGFAGATILGDGTAALILDVAQLVEGGQAEGPTGRPSDSVKEAA